MHNLNRTFAVVSYDITWQKNLFLYGNKRQLDSTLKESVRLRKRLQERDSRQILRRENLRESLFESSRDHLL